MSTPLTLLPALCSVALIAGWAGLAHASSPESGDLEAFEALFGYQGFPQADINVFPQWLTVVAQDFNRYDTVACDAVNKSQYCGLTQWHDFLRSIEDLAPEAQLDAVNSFVNDRYYVDDTENYGVDDYWATPKLFLQNGGDCEDYVIMKLWSLRLLGWPDDALRMVVVQDTKRKQPHAVLAVSSKEQIWILDNQSPVVLPQRSIAHYAPVYSLSTQRWWLHKPQGKHL